MLNIGSLFFLSLSPPILQLFTYHLHCIRHYKQYTEMIQSIQEDVYRLYRNMTPNYIRDFENCRLWYLWGPTTNPPWIPRVNHISSTKFIIILPKLKKSSEICLIDKKIYTFFIIKMLEASHTTQWIHNPSTQSGRCSLYQCRSLEKRTPPTENLKCFVISQHTCEMNDLWLETRQMPSLESRWIREGQ